MTERFYVASPGVLALRTNHPTIKWSWGINMPEADRSTYDRVDLKVRFTVHETAPETCLRPTAGKYHYFSGVHGADSVEYRRTFVGGRDLWLRLSGLVSGDIHLEVNRTYARYISHRFMNLHSPGYILTDVAAWALLRRGYCPLHCAAFEIDGSTVVVLAPPNTGKTLTTMTACFDYGANFLAEDVAITDGNIVYGVPWTSTFRYYDSIDPSRSARARNTLTRVFPPLELLPGARSSRIDDLLSAAQILDMGEVTVVAVLERGPTSVVDIPEAGALLRQATNLNRYEFKYTLSPALVAYEYFNPEIDLMGAQARETATLERLVTGAQRRLLVQSADASEYASLLVSALKQDA